MKSVYYYLTIALATFSTAVSAHDIGHIHLHTAHITILLMIIAIIHLVIRRRHQS